VVVIEPPVERPEELGVLGLHPAPPKGHPQTTPATVIAASAAHDPSSARVSFNTSTS
jgi:hypothetical protein